MNTLFATLHRLYRTYLASSTPPNADVVTTGTTLTRSMATPPPIASALLFFTLPRTQPSRVAQGTQPSAG